MPIVQEYIPKYTVRRKFLAIIMILKDFKYLQQRHVRAVFSVIFVLRAVLYSELFTIRFNNINRPKIHICNYFFIIEIQTINTDIFLGSSLLFNSIEFCMNNYYSIPLRIMVSRFQTFSLK